MLSVAPDATATASVVRGLMFTLPGAFAYENISLFKSSTDLRMNGAFNPVVSTENSPAAVVLMVIVLAEESHRVTVPEAGIPEAATPCTVEVVCAIGASLPLLRPHPLIVTVSVMNASMSNEYLIMIKSTFQNELM